MSPPRPPFPDPACRLPDEYPMLAAVLAAPHDDLPKLVYADWLEERADPRGPFLRRWVHSRQTRHPPPKPLMKVPSWCDLIGYTLASSIEWEKEPWGEAVWKTTEPGIQVRTKPHKGRPLSVGASKMGGFPDLPPDFPASEGMTDGPPAFVAQWNLEELALSPVCRALPKTGLLSFAEGDGMMVVAYLPDLRVLERRTTKDEYHVLPECRVEFLEHMTLPHWSSPTLKKYRLDEDDLDDYMDYYAGYVGPQVSHQILGHATPFERVPFPDTRDRQRLLTQFGPDANLDWANYGDTWYHMIRDRDLKKANFDHVYAESQSE